MASTTLGTNHEALTQKLSVFGRPKLIKKCQEYNLSIFGSKADLISRIVDVMSTQRDIVSKKMKHRKKKVQAPPPSPLQMAEPIYNEENDSRVSHHAKSTSRDSPKKSRKFKPKPKSKRKASSNDSPTKMTQPTKIATTNKSTEDVSDTEVTKFLYEIIDMRHRPNLNGKHCKIVQVMTRGRYRISLINNGSEQILHRDNVRKITAKHCRQKPIHMLTIRQETSAATPTSSTSSTSPSTSPTIDSAAAAVDDDALANMQQAISRHPRFVTNAQHLTVHGVGVFVHFSQMILKVFSSSNVECLFGSQYKTFRCECLFLLESICGDARAPHYKVLKNERHALLFYECNDKQVICVVDYDRNLPMTPLSMQLLSGLQVIDCSLIDAANAYTLHRPASSLARMEKIFDAHDVHGFGEINHREFNKFLSALTVNHCIKKSSSSALFRQIDTQEINAVTFCQFAYFMRVKKNVMWQLLLELAEDYELDDSVTIDMYQTFLSKIHKLLLIMYEMYDTIAGDTCCTADEWERKMVTYIDFINSNQRLIDKQIIHMHDHNDDDDDDDKKRKQMLRMSRFIRDNMPSIA